MGLRLTVPVDQAGGVSLRRHPQRHGHLLARAKDKGGIRTQFHHVIDVTPTIYEAVGIKPPAILDGVPQKPIEGVSMLYAIDDAKAPSTRKTQYFEMLGNRALYNDGWIASTTPKRLPWQPKAKPGSDDPLTFNWELYHLSKDFTQATDLAKENPDKPSYSVTAEVNIPEGGVEGVLATQGGSFGGWGLIVLDGKPLYVHALSNQPQHKYKVEKLIPGKHTIRFEFKYDGGGIGKGGSGGAGASRQDDLLPLLLG